jgi:SLOG in TRPM, prokaryote
MELTSIILKDHTIPVVRPESFEELPRAWQFLGFNREQSAIVIVGGAGGMTEDDIARVQMFFEKYLVPFARKKTAVFIEGGTDSGVMAAIGRARKLTGGDIPLIGVVARDIEQVESMLEPNHTHFILCPGSNWGDESEWIAASASALAASQPSVTIMINGGQIAWNDARVNIRHGRAVLIAEGSGRTADVIATTSTGVAFDPNAIALLRTGKVHVANFFKNPERFIEKLDDLMK